MHEPGLDQHNWETRWQQIEPELHDAPAETLPELDRLVGEMLAARGYELDDPIVRDGEDREVVADFLAARDITQRYDGGAEDLSPGDVAAAINAYRELYEHVLAAHRAP